MSDLITRLIAAGTPADLVAEVAMLAARAEVEREAIESRRKSDRERQANRRAAQKGEGVTVCHVTSRDVADVTGQTPPSPSPLPSPCTPNQPPAPTHPDINTRGRARPAARMPEGWEPEPLAGPIAEAVAKWPPGALDRELDKFRDWARSTAGPNAKKSDWQATYRNWLRKADEDGKYRNGQRQFDGMGRDRSSPTLGALHDFVNRTPY